MTVACGQRRSGPRAAGPPAGRPAAIRIISDPGPAASLSEPRAAGLSGPSVNVTARCLSDSEAAAAGAGVRATDGPGASHVPGDVSH